MVWCFSISHYTICSFDVANQLSLPRPWRMPPLRHRDLTSSPLMVRRITRSLSINVSLANDNHLFSKPSETGKLESAFAAKERELSLLISPTPKSPFGAQRTTFHRLCHKSFPETIDSFKSYNAMKTIFLNYLTQNRLHALIPESKLYWSVYLPYGYIFVLTFWRQVKDWQVGWWWFHAVTSAPFSTIISSW